jgi:rare lipoprotein A
MTQRFLYLLLSVFSVLTISGQEKTTHEKEKSKEKATKVTDVKENIEQKKIVLSTKVDTTKFKVKNILQEIDTTSNAMQGVNLKLLKKKAHASYYHQKFHGRRTASGKIFDNTALTAAHKKLPFGTKVKVTNEANGKSVIVEINDRGPFSKAREIDLTKRAFTEIANKNAGVIYVTIEVIEEK